MKKKKLLLFIILCLFLISIYSITLLADTYTYVYNDKEYTISYEYEGNSATNYEGPMFEEDFGRIIFSNMVITIEVDNNTYIIESNKEESMFYLDDLDDVEDYQEYKDTLVNTCMNDEFYNIYNSKNAFYESISNKYYDVDLSLNENKNSLSVIYDSFIESAIKEMDDNYEYLYSHDIEVLNIIKDDYLNLGGTTTSLNTYAIDISYASFNDMIDDYNTKVSFDLLKDEKMMMIYRLIRAHDDEDIYNTLEEATTLLYDLKYEKCLSNRVSYLVSLKEELEEVYTSAKDMIFLFQAKERFRNYFTEYKDNLDYYMYDLQDEINLIIEEATIKLEDINYYEAVYELKDETLNKINNLKISTLSTYNGEIEASDGINADASLVIKEVKNEDFSEAAYDISLVGDTASKQAYKISIYDVELKHDDVDVYIINNKGIKSKLDSTYENNVLTIETDTLGKVYVVRKNEAPWGEMAIVFGGLLLVTVATLVVLNRGKKDEE